MTQPDLSRFDSDPEALAWARGKVQHVADRFRAFSQHATERGDKNLSAQWRKFANLLEMELIAGKGCVIQGFDERLPLVRGLPGEPFRDRREPPGDGEPR